MSTMPFSPPSAFLDWLATQLVERYSVQPRSTEVRRLKSIATQVKSLEPVMAERDRQDRRWGQQNHPPLYWLGILSEEVGETAKDTIEGNDFLPELIQVAAVALAWIEAEQRRRLNPPKDGYMHQYRLIVDAVASVRGDDDHWLSEEVRRAVRLGL